MNVKSFVITCVVLYIVSQGLGFLVHGVWLDPVYQALEAEAIFRPMEEMNQMMWVMFLTGAIWVVAFTYIFARGREGKGIMEGIRFGAVIGVFYSLTVTYNAYVVYPVPYDLVLKWFISDFVIIVILGIVASLVYKPSN